MKTQFTDGPWRTGDGFRTVFRPETQFTDGPWRTGDGFRTVFRPETLKPCLAVIADIHGKTFDELKANACLVATAPELFAAAVDALAGFVALCEEDEAVNQNRKIGKKMLELHYVLIKANGGTI